jgi:hypothetical protein
MMHCKTIIRCLTQATFASRERKPQGSPAALLRDVVFDAMLGGAP